MVKNPPAMQETRVWSLGLEDPLEKGKATHSSILWPGEFHGLYSPRGCNESDMTESLSLHIRNLIMIKMIFYNQSTWYIRDSPYFVKQFNEKKKFYRESTFDLGLKILY